MKIFIASIAAATLLGLPAMAETPKGCSPTGIHLLQEDEDGNNCPTTQAERNLGQFVLFVILSPAILEAGGVDVFPLNAGVLAGT